MLPKKFPDCLYQCSLLWFLSLFFVYCNVSTSGQESKQELAGGTVLFSVLQNSQTKGSCKSSGQFWARSLGREQYSYCLGSTLVASSKNLNIYLENGLTTDLNYNSIASIFEEKIFPITTSSLSMPSDINRDGRIDVLILNIRDGAEVGGGFIAGYVDPVNFQRDSANLSVRSNEREVIYLDGAELLELRKRHLTEGKSDPFLATLSHELQHLIRFQYSLGADEVWIDEGTSELVSDITGFGPQSSRLSCFKGDISKSQSCAGGINGVSLVNWSNTLRSYSYAYTFFKFIYFSAGYSEEERMVFLKNTVQGKDSIRGNNVKNLMTQFKKSTKYNSNLLGNGEAEVFSKLLGVFLAQSINYSNLNQVYVGNNTAVNWSEIKNFYPIPTDMKEIYSPNSLQPVPAKNYQFQPTYAYRLQGNLSGINSADLVAIQSDTDYIIFHKGMEPSGSVVTASSVLEHTQEFQMVCPHEKLLQENQKNFSNRQFLLPSVSAYR